MFKKTARSPLIRLLASLKLTVLGLMFLIVLVIWGTVYQAEYGLFAAQVKFFYSWIIFIMGVIPFPGTLLVCGVLFINLVAAALFRLSYRWSQLGMILIHYGLLLLLIGGFYSFQQTQESYITLVEGESTNFSNAYHQWELAIWTEVAGEKQVTAVDTDLLKPGRELDVKDQGLKIGVREKYPNCRWQRGDPQNPMSGELKPFPISAEPSENIPGLELQVGFESGQEKGLILYGGQLDPRILQTEGIPHFFVLRLKRFLLPFSLKLLDFKKKVYPGSDIPRSFESRVEIASAVFSREAVISMNRPLRYQAYTLFQASYQEGVSGRESSTLQVVRNPGRFFPYVASVLIFLGLAFHFVIKLASSARGPGIRNSHV